MPDPLVIRRLERRLIEMGCPEKETRRQVREMVEHHEDLKTAAMEEGLPEPEAEARADQRLGDPVALADRLAGAFRRSSWWGRHRVTSFCLLPLLSFFPVWLALILVALALTRVCCSAQQWAALKNVASVVAAGEAFTAVANGLAILMVTLLFCWLARRSAAGWGWVFAVCILCAVECGLLIGSCGIQQRSITFGIAWHSDHVSICAMIPLAIGVAEFARRRRSLRQTLPEPESVAV